MTPEYLSAGSAGSAGSDPPAIEIAAVHRAAVHLGVRVDEVRVVSRRRTGIYRAVVTAAPSRSRSGDRFPVGRTVQAARVVSIEDSITPAAVTHRVLYRLRQTGASVAGPLHPESVATGAGHVGFWDWLHDTCITPGTWGHLTGAFHRAGRRLPASLKVAVGAYDPGRAFEPRVRRARELTSTPGHPLHGAGALVRRFETALEHAVRVAARAVESDQQAPVLILGDNQPGNIMAGPGGLVLNDVERMAIGPVAVDLAALVLGVQHYGYPASVAGDFCAGYGPAAPSVEQATPFARIRELSGAVVAMLGAGDGPEAEREMQVRATVIGHSGEGERWTYLGDPDAVHLAGLPSADKGHDCRAGRPPADASESTPVDVDRGQEAGQRDVRNSRCDGMARPGEESR
jgi:hypothetical protein